MALASASCGRHRRPSSVPWRVSVWRRMTLPHLPGCPSSMASARNSVGAHLLDGWVKEWSREWRNVCRSTQWVHSSYSPASFGTNHCLASKSSPPPLAVSSQYLPMAISVFRLHVSVKTQLIFQCCLTFSLLLSDWKKSSPLLLWALSVSTFYFALQILYAWFLVGTSIC